MVLKATWRARSGALCHGYLRAATDRRLGSLYSTHSAPRLSTISEYHASVFAFPCLCFVGVTKRNGGTAELRNEVEGRIAA